MIEKFLSRNKMNQRVDLNERFNQLIIIFIINYQIGFFLLYDTFTLYIYIKDENEEWRMDEMNVKENVTEW